MTYTQQKEQKQLGKIPNFIATFNLVARLSELVFKAAFYNLGKYLQPISKKLLYWLKNYHVGLKCVN